MTTRQKALTLISQFNADWQENSVDNGLDGDAWLPAGKVWVASGCHSLVVHTWSNRPAAWQALLSDLQQGIIPCDLVPCDTCDS
jgi:hypothetical protein